MKTFRRTAGGVVIGPEQKIAVVNQNNTSWSLPKGGVDGDESDIDAARREVYEETGIYTLRLICSLGSYKRARIGKNGIGELPTDMKELHFFLFSTNQSELQPEDPDNPEAQWVRIEKVSSMLTHQKDKEFFESIIPVLKRHLKQL